MAARGWYPDPSGVPGRYRYWDGSSWSAETTGDPTARPPARRSHRRPALLFAVAGLLLVMVIIATVVILVRANGPRPDADPPPSTASSWDDASAAASSPPDASSAVPSPAGAPSGEASARPDGSTMPPPTGSPRPASAADCGSQREDRFAEQTEPGRIRGGDLSFARPPAPWHPVVDNTYALGWSWATDIGGASETIDYGDNANLFAGRVVPLRKESPETPRHAATRLTGCVLRSYLDQDLHVGGVRQLVSQPFRVSGRPGWLIRSQTAVDDLQHGAQGFLVDLVVIDTGGQLSFFYGEIPYPDAQRIAVMDATVDGLTVV